MVEIHFLESLACQIWKEAFKNARRQKYFKMGRTSIAGNFLFFFLVFNFFSKNMLDILLARYVYYML